MKVSRLTPNFKTDSIGDTIRFYQDTLGFTLGIAVPETQDGIHQALDPNTSYCFATLIKDELELMFERSDSFQQGIDFAPEVPTGASVSFYMEIEGLDELHQNIMAKNVKTTPIKTTWYGMREFYLLDNNGYVLGFAQKAD